MNRDDFRQAILQSPSDTALRLVYADWLEEQGEPDAILHRWLGSTGRRPLYLPTGHQVWFPEGVCSAVQHTLPLPIYNNLTSLGFNPFKSTTYRLKHCPTGCEWDNELLNVFNSAGNGLLSKLFRRSQYVPSNDPPLQINPVPKAKLEFTQQVRRSDGYSTVEALESISIDEGIRIAMRGPLAERGNFFIPVRLGKWHIATADVDIPDANGTEAFLKYNGLGYIKFESTPDHFWYIADFASSYYTSAAVVVQHLQDNDTNFVRCCNGRGHFTLRGERRGFKPRLVEENVTSPILKSFLTQWLNHWDDKRLDEIYRWRIDAAAQPAIPAQPIADTGY